MKKLVAAFLALCTLALPTLGMAKTDYHSIAQLREKTPTRWQETYETARGETVTVDCEVVLPEVDAFPVLKVAWMPKRSAAVEEEWTEGLIHWSGWDEYICPHGVRIAFTNVPGEFICSKDGLCEYMLPYYKGNKDYSWETTLILPDALDLSVAYPENCDVTLGEAIAYYQTLLDTFFADDGVKVRLSPTLLSSYNGITYSVKGQKPITPCGEYHLNFEQVINGIPVLGLINEAFTESLRDVDIEKVLLTAGGRGNLSWPYRTWIFSRGCAFTPSRRPPPRMCR